MNTIVRRPVALRTRSASLITSRISLMPASTALNDTKRAFVRSAMIRASVVLPVPGGPHRMIDCSRSRSIASRSGLPGASRSSWPTSSSKVRGRIRSASGAGAGEEGAFSTTLSSKSESISPRGHEVRRALAACFVQQQRGGDGGVERLDRRFHRNRDAIVCGGENGRRHPGALAADDNGGGTLQVGLEEGPAV